MSRPKGWKRLATTDRKPRRKVYPWAAIEVGEGFFVWSPDSARRAAREASAKHDREFEVKPSREVLDGIAFNGARVTRIR